MMNDVINPLSASETSKIGPKHREVGRRHAWSAVLAGITLALAGYRRSARAQAVALVAVDIRTVDQGYRPQSCWAGRCKTTRNRRSAR